MFGITLSPAIVWAIIGIVFVIIELATFTFILSFLGVAAIIVSLTTWSGLTPGINSQLAVFSISSILMMLLLRKTARRLFAGTNDVKPDYTGQKVKVIRAIPVGGEGAIVYRGSDWIAFSDYADIIHEGTVVEIVLIEGIRIKVKPIVS
jgi:membrane protein implicated in regulation of membrane protease activity